MLLYHHPIVIMIYCLYKADTPRTSEINIRGIPRASNFHPVTEIGGEINYGTTSNDLCKSLQ